MTPEQVQIIRNLQACNVPWPVIAKTLKATILECRTVLGLPTYGTPERQAMPWHLTQQTLPFDK